MNTVQKRVPGLAFLLALMSFILSPAALPCAQGQDWPKPEPKVITVDDLFAEVGRKVPAFGGLFVDEERDTLYVYIAPGQPGDKAALDQAIKDVFGSARPPEHQVEVLVGRYTFSQLKNWHDRMSLQLLAIPGVLSTGIDDARNGLKVEVQSRDLAPVVQATLAALGIPSEAVRIDEAAPGEFAESP